VSATVALDAPQVTVGRLMPRLPEGQQPRLPAERWPQTCLPPAAVIEHVMALPTGVRGTDAKRAYRLGLRHLLNWLAEQPGTTWQERWHNSGADDAGRGWRDLPRRWLAQRGERAGHHDRLMPCAMMMLLCGQIVRPSYQWLIRIPMSRGPENFRTAVDPEGFASLAAQCQQPGYPTAFERHHGLNSVTWIMMRKGGLVQDVTIGDCLELRDALSANDSSCSGAQSYLLLARAGIFGPNPPPRLQNVIVRSQRTPAELVDQYAITNAPIRELLVDYISELVAGRDYTTMASVARDLAKLFWKDLENHHPGIDSLNLPPAVAAAWKERSRFVWDRDGRQLRPRASNTALLLSVRALYRDLARWAANDPARWGRWVAPCPIRDAECNQRKQLASRKARIDQRTRTLLPALPGLVDAVTRRHRAAITLLDAARQVPPETEFTAAARRMRRCRRVRGTHVRCTDVDSGRTHDLTFEEADAFWAWALVEVLRHTGMRIEEILELTHHSFVAYTLPTTGEVVPMLQVAPSKNDAERLLLVSPELGEVLTAIIHRVRGANAAIPLVSAYDELELVWSPPMPFLFQRTFNTEHRHMPRAYVSACLNRAVAASGLTDAANAPLSFTPHDFRRLFVTDAVRSGLPPHIAAAICGHQLLDTTMGYAAIYPEDVIDHHRAFIARRRAQRPSEEYRDLKPEEWDEFLDHFELRKVALGVCTRDYGTPCIHEHACVRCPQLRPDPAQMPRLKEIRANLLDRMQEAKDRGWLGEVAAIEASLVAADRKLEAMSAITARHIVTHLGMPDFRAATGRSTSDP
jgi:integrase